MTDPCATYPTLLAWLENDLSEEEPPLLNAHVPNCEDCRDGSHPLSLSN